MVITGAYIVEIMAYYTHCITVEMLFAIFSMKNIDVFNNFYIDRES